MNLLRIIVSLLLVGGLGFTAERACAQPAAATASSSAKTRAPPEIEAMVSKLAARLKQKPDDPKGWAMLAKSYAVLGRNEDAVAAYAKAVEKAPADPDLLADYADAMALSRGPSLKGEPEALALRALKIDPNHTKALMLAGNAAFERKDYGVAINYWEKLMTLVPADSDMAHGVQVSLKAARSQVGGGAAPLTPATSTAAAGASGTVTLAAALAGKAAAGDVVFVFARPPQGPRMPVAILKKKVSDLPLKFTLDDSMAMSAAARLSGTPQVVIVARISKSGDAMPQRGDLQGASKVVGNTQKDVAIVIDSEVP